VTSYLSLDIAVRTFNCLTVASRWWFRSNGVSTCTATSIFLRIDCRKNDDFEQNCDSQIEATSSIMDSGIRSKNVFIGFIKDLPFGITHIYISEDVSSSRNLAWEDSGVFIFRGSYLCLLAIRHTWLGCSVSLSSVYDALMGRNSAR